MQQPIALRPSRRDRRAAAAAERRAHNRAVQHDCVLQSDCIEAGVAVHVSSREWHTFHIARGEETCPACPLCQRIERERGTPKKMGATDRSIVLAAWKAKIEWHVEQAKQNANEESST